MVVVLFEIKKRPGVGGPEYEALLDRMNAIVESIPGYISSVDYVSEDGKEISLVRFETLEALEAWRKQPEHVQTQKRARDEFYEWYHVEVLTTVREYSFKRGEGRTKLFPPAARPRA